MLDKKIKKDFPIFKNKVHGKDLVYLDNAATSQKPKAVINALVDFYEQTNANIHRGVYLLSEKATDHYEQARQTVADFINASSAEEIVFTKGATEGLNLLAYSFCKSFLKKGDEVLITAGEHHSNMIPWQRAVDLFGIKLKQIPLFKNGRLDFAAYQNLLTPKVKLVSIAQASNTSGVIHPVEKIIKEAHQKQIPVCLDACQSVPHLKFDLQRLDCDFAVFSGHKMLGPTGIGVFYGRKKNLEEMEPYQTGGGMISQVKAKKSSWAGIPQKFEAGTPNIAGAIGLAEAIRYLDEIGLENIHRHELELIQKTLAVMNKDPKIQIYGPEDMENRCGIISFGIKGVHPHDIATVLDQEGVAIRAGHHCSQMMMNTWGTNATARVSFYLYNNEDDVEIFLRAIEKVKFIFGL